MGIPITIFLLALLCISSAPAQPTFEKLIGQFSNGIGNSVTGSFNGGFIIGGSINARRFTATPCIIKLDSAGNEQWTRIIDDSLEGAVSSIISTFDSGTVAIGYGDRGSPGDGFFFITKSDTGGGTIWTFLSRTPSPHETSVIQTNDSGFAISGFANDFGIGILKLDKNGNVQWSVAGPFQAPIVQFNDGRLIAIGTAGDSSGREVYAIYMISSEGKIIRSTGLALDGTISVHSIVKTFDGGFAVCGESLDGPDAPASFIGKFDSNGHLLWNQVVSAFGHQHAQSIIEAPNTDLIVVGDLTYNNSSSGRTDSLLLIRLDSTGNATLIRFSGLPEYSTNAKSIITTSDGGFFLTGSITGSFLNERSLFAAKLDSSLFDCHFKESLVSSRSAVSTPDSVNIAQYNLPAYFIRRDTSLITFILNGVDICSFPDTKANSFEGSMSVYPNPLPPKYFLKAHFEGMIPENFYEVLLSDMLGKVRAKTLVIISNLERNSYLFGSQLPAGSYFVELWNSSLTKRWMKTKLVVE